MTKFINAQGFLTLRYVTKSSRELQEIRMLSNDDNVRDAITYELNLRKSSDFINGSI